MLSSLLSSSKSCAQQTQRPQAFKSLRHWVSDRVERRKQRWTVNSPVFQNLNQTWNNESNVRFLPYLPPACRPNVTCSNQKGRTTNRWVREAKTTSSLHAVKVSDASFNEFWNPPHSTTKDFTLSTDKRRGQHLLHKLHHNDTHTHTYSTQPLNTLIYYDDKMLSWVFGSGEYNKWSDFIS